MSVMKFVIQSLLSVGALAVVLFWQLSYLWTDPSVPAPDWAASMSFVLEHWRLQMVYLAIGYILVYQLSFLKGSPFSFLRSDVLVTGSLVLFTSLSLMQLQHWVSIPPRPLSILVPILIMLAQMVLLIRLARDESIEIMAKRANWMLPLSFTLGTMAMGPMLYTLPLGATVISTVIALLYWKNRLIGLDDAPAA